MKKTISIILSLLLIFGLATCVYGAASLNCSTSASSVTAGKTFTVTVSAKDVGSVKSIGLTPTYDSTAFEITGTDCLIGGTSLAKFDKKNVAIAFENPVTPSGKIYSFTFKVKADAKTGTYILKVAGTFKNDSKGTSVSASGSVKITITCNHKYGSWTKVSEPSCTKAGSEKRTCSLCGNTETRSIAATGHKFGGWSTKKEPSCTKEGQKVRTCSVCGAEEKASIKALGHDLKEKTITLEATCTTHGQATGLCTRCGQIATVSTPLADHVYGEWTETKASTCTVPGIKTHSCEICGHIEDEASLPLGHDFKESAEIQKATIYSEGISEAICSRCGEAQRITTPCRECFEDMRLIFDAQPGAFENGTQITAEIQEPSEEEKGIYTKYAISFALEENTVLPKNTYEITFPIPEGYGRNISVNIIDEDGNRTEIPCIINLYDNTVKIQTNAAGCFEITNIDKVPPVYEGLSPQQQNYLIMGGLAFTTLLFFILYVTKKPKKANNGENV